MKILNIGPNACTLYHYMSCKGYTPNFSVNSGKREVIFTKTIHNPEFPVNPSLKGLVIVHKVQVDIYLGCVQKHWLENRGLPITCWAYLHLLEELQEQSIKTFNEMRHWCKGGWISQFEAQKTK